MKKAFVLFVFVVVAVLAKGATFLTPVTTCSVEMAKVTRIMPVAIASSADHNSFVMFDEQVESHSDFVERKRKFWKVMDLIHSVIGIAVLCIIGYQWIKTKDGVQVFGTIYMLLCPMLLLVVLLINTIVWLLGYRGMYIFF